MAEKKTSTKKKEKREYIKAVTPVVRFAFLYAKEPDSGREYSDDKYKVTMLLPKDREAELKPLKLKVLEAARAEWGDEIKYKDLEVPFKDGDEVIEAKDDKGKSKLAAYEGQIIFTAKSKRAPGIVGNEKDEDGKPIAITADDIKSGDYGRASISFYAYERPQVIMEGGKKRTIDLKGVSLNLDNLQRLQAGKRLGGMGDPSADFNDGVTAEGLELPEAEDEENEGNGQADDETFEDVPATKSAKGKKAAVEADDNDLID